ncbi:hypothetical protein [Streptomyces xinghaiensis]|uniref:hypothetical protein n=1 Tax=Streptomyces xinghaiensis TaxID=1038928 RepID=UPI001864E750|nr:hypothetical protein [Streptomyces xinghaiensis]
MTGAAPGAGGTGGAPGGPRTPWRFTPEQLAAADRRLRAMVEPHEQLRAARQQAEGYRNFIASLTGLIGAVFVLKGRENLLDLPGWWRWAVIGLLAASFAALIAASWLTVSAVHGPPGYTPTLDATRVLDYETERTRAIWRMVGRARGLALAGMLAIAAAVLLTWVAPVQEETAETGKAATPSCGPVVTAALLPC